MQQHRVFLRIKTLFALSVLSLALTSSEAALNPAGGSWPNATIVSVTACTAARCPPHGWVTVQLSGNATGNPPTCSNENRNSVAIDTSEGAGGGFAAAMLQSSMMLGTSITITGTGKCSVDPVIETAGTVTESPDSRFRRQ